MDQTADKRARVIGAMANRRQLGVTFADERMTILRWTDVAPKDQADFERPPEVAVNANGDVEVSRGGRWFMTVSGSFIRTATDKDYASEIGVLPIPRD